MNVLVIGNGGREFAIIRALQRSPQNPVIYCAPGIDALEKDIHNLRIPLGEHDRLIAEAANLDIGLVIIGPEAPLVNGFGDQLQEAGIPVFGPTSSAARLESSKVFAKELMKEYGIPTARYESFRHIEGARRYVETLRDFPVVIKASGLAAGKGVVIAETRNEALATVDAMMAESIFGEAGSEIVIESFLKGEEASVFAICDGSNYVVLTPAQDHKRIGEGDSGPNTGGMGAYAPAPVVTESVMQRVRTEIIEPTLNAMQAQNDPFKGVLYCGLMIEAGAPSVVEFNVRFGDPETQVVLPLLKSDFLALCVRAATGQLAGYHVELDTDRSAMTVVAVSGGYPGSYEKGKTIRGLDEIAQVEVLHAGTKRSHDGFVTNGGRVLNLVATGKTLQDAADQIYKEIDLIHFDGITYRRDIGHRALNR